MEPLEPADAFPYLGRTITCNNSYWEAVYHKLWKTQRRLGTISKVLTKAGATVRDHGMLYIVVGKTVILYGSESLLVTGAILKVLEGFHHRASQNIAKMTD